MEIRLYVFRKNFNPRSPHGERLSTHTANSPDVTISIHAPRTGSDEHLRRYIILCDISIHAPRTGSDDAIIDYQSAGFTDFNPRSPHGERHFICCPYNPKRLFQSTLPARGATGADELEATGGLFQSTLPARGATTWGAKKYASEDISIHAPRTGSDKKNG